MHHPYFFTGREQELACLIDRGTNGELDLAACVGTDPDSYHPDEGQPDEVTLARCKGCPARLACLALALRAEDPDMRAGWYGGLSPTDRDDVAELLQLEASAPPAPDRALEAARLRAAGWTVPKIATHLACSDRTVQRYLRAAA